MAKETRLITPKARLAWPNLFAAKQRTDQGGKPTGDPKFGLTLIFDAAAQSTPQFAALKAEVQRIASEKFGRLPPALKARVSLPFGDGALKVDEQGKPYPGYGPGTVYISATSKIRPDVCGGAQEPLAEADVYAGCYVRASVVAFDYDTSGNKGVTFGLRNVQKLADGEAFAQGIKAADEFGAVEGYQSTKGDFGGAPHGASPNSFAQQMSGDEDSIPF